MRRLHLVDGTFELYRAHFSPRPSRPGPDGRDAKATLGLVESMLALMRDKEESVTHLAIAFDDPIRSFRNDLFDGYKDDSGVPQQLRSQFESAHDGVRALGLVVWVMDRWEADDVLATAAVRFRDAVDQVRILTPDKDLGQVVDGTRIVQVDRIHKKVIDEAAVREARGVPPALVPDLLALVGDDADGIPGVMGFGEKTAAALLMAHGGLDAIPDDPAAWKAPVRGAARLAETLRTHREAARLYRRLATLVTDVPLPQTFEDLAVPASPPPAFTAWARSAGLRPRGVSTGEPS